MPDKKDLKKVRKSLTEGELSRGLTPEESIFLQKEKQAFDEYCKARNTSLPVERLIEIKQKELDEKRQEIKTLLNKLQEEEKDVLELREEIEKWLKILSEQQQVSDNKAQEEKINHEYKLAIIKITIEIEKAIYDYIDIEVNKSLMKDKVYVTESVFKFPTPTNPPTPTPLFSANLIIHANLVRPVVNQANKNLDEELKLISFRPACQKKYPNETIDDEKIKNYIFNEEKSFFKDINYKVAKKYYELMKEQNEKVKTDNLANKPISLKEITLQLRTKRKQITWKCDVETLQSLNGNPYLRRDFLKNTMLKNLGDKTLEEKLNFFQTVVDEFNEIISDENAPKRKTCWTDFFKRSSILIYDESQIYQINTLKFALKVILASIHGCKGEDYKSVDAFMNPKTGKARDLIDFHTAETSIGALGLTQTRQDVNALMGYTKPNIETTLPYPPFV